jgi:hypothetical protein
MYQKITFTFAPTVGDAIRIRGTPGGTLGYTTIMELEVEGSLDPNADNIVNFLDFGELASNWLDIMGQEL